MGNLRVSFREGAEYRYEVGMEPYRAIEENLLFANVSTTLAGDGTARTGKESSKLNTAKSLGPWKTIAVKRGDHISASVYGLYKDNVANPANNKPLSLYLTTASIPTSGGGEKPHLFDLLKIGVVSTLTPLPAQQNTLVPNAFLKYIVYNAQEEIVRIDHVMLPETAKDWWKELTFNLAIEEDGSIQIMLANESEQYVWFDDLLIEHQQGLIVQENHYDPFGPNLAFFEV